MATPTEYDRTGKKRSSRVACIQSYGKTIAIETDKSWQRLILQLESTERLLTLLQSVLTLVKHCVNGDKST